MSCDLLCFKITVKLVGKGPIGPQECGENTKRLTESAYLAVVFILFGLILHSQMNVYAAAPLGSVDGTWSKLDRTHCPWNWLWVVSELPVEAAVWQQRLLTCVSQKQSVVHNFERRGSSESEGTLGSKVTVRFPIGSFECEWFKLVWPNWSSDAKSFLILDTEAHTHTYCSLTLDPGDLWYDPLLAVSPHFRAASF